MFTSLFAFLGGTAFRLIWGEVSAWLNKKLEHAQEMERIQAQEGIDAAKHARQQDLIKLQHELGIKEIQVAGNIEVEKLATAAFVEAQKNFKPTGVKWVDGWNGTIRPAAATFSLLLWFGNVAAYGFKVTTWDQDLIAGVLGFFFADRSLARRGK
jgi:hypothetical protein